MKKITCITTIIFTVSMFAIPQQAESQLNRTNGLYGGVINGIVTDGGEKYAITPEFLYRYDEAEERWKNLKIRFNDVSFDNFAAHDGVLYVAWNEGTEFEGSQVSVMKSADQGETWTNISPPNSSNGIRFLDIAGDYIFIENKNGLEQFSQDGGESWQEIDYGGNGFIDITKTDNNYFLQTYTGLHRSDDGIEWEELEFDFSDNIFSILADEKKLFALTNDNELFLSEDDSESWTSVFTSPDDEKHNLRLELAGNGVVLIKNNAGAPDQFYYSDDFDQEWELVELQVDGRIMVSDSTLYLNDYPDLLYSDDFGNNWQAANVYGLTSRSANVFEVLGNTTIVSPDYSSEYQQPQELNITYNSGESWDDLLFDPEKGSARLHSMTIDATGDLIAAAGYGTDRYLYRSNDDGETWEEVSNTVVHHIRNKGNTLLATGDTNGEVNPRIQTSKLIISDDGGLTWNRIEISHDDEYVHSLHTSDDLWLAVVNNQNPELFVTDDSGEAWEQILAGDFTINSISQIGTDIYIGTSDGLKMGNAMDNEWETNEPGHHVSHTISEGRYLFYTIDDKLYQLDTEDDVVSEISSDETGTINRLKIRGDNLYVASKTGLWALDISELPTSISEEIVLANQVTLKQNYPNPFNPATTISFTIPLSGNVELQVFDMLGRHVETLVNNHRAAGTHTISFDASTLASGVYIYRLKAGEFITSKLLHLVK